MKMFRKLGHDLGSLWRIFGEFLENFWRRLGGIFETTYDLEYKLIDMRIRPSIQPKLVIMSHN
jgi:hypothetical protein